VGVAIIDLAQAVERAVPVEHVAADVEVAVDLDRAVVGELEGRAGFVDQPELAEGDR